MALALYQKYRPKNLDSILGHETNIKILKRAAAGNRLGHAYLFHGPRGTGKTSTARLIAKLLNCEKRAEDKKFCTVGEPCNECISCTEVDAFRALDVMEIDAASNRGIEEIRNLKENIKTSPVRGRYKVYIIDEAHMLTGPAFNALLKTLEEPPKHAAFILATTEYEKLPATITSRTQRFLFKKIPKLAILEKLTAIAKEEGIDISPEALELIASAGEGSARDAESLLDQLSALGGAIDLAAAERTIGRAGFRKVEDAALMIMKKDLKGSIATLSKIHEEGHDLVTFAKDLIHHLRKALALSLNGDLEETFAATLTKEELERLKDLTKLVDPKWHANLIRSLIRAYGEMRYSPFAMIPLEIALVETIGEKT